MITFHTTKTDERRYEVWGIKSENEGGILVPTEKVIIAVRFTRSMARSKAVSLSRYLEKRNK